MNWMKKFFFGVVVLCISGKMLAHPMPSSIVELSILETSIRGEAKIPLLELANAVGDGRVMNLHDPFFQTYFGEHIKAVSEGKNWVTQIQGIEAVSDTNAIVGKYKEVIVRFTLTPPGKQYLRSFTFNYDAVMHQVITHSALVSVKQDWSNGIGDENAQQVGVIRLDVPSGKIYPLQVNLQEGSYWKGFSSMLRLGMQHIKEGTDHLLFLLVLLLPAMLLVNGKRWGRFGGLKYSIVRLLKIVTAFTVGHSVTLLLGALGWVRLPGQPVEILIAVSILVSAVHAVRPLFPGKEVFIAAGFGLIHGLAFASVLANLNLSAGRLALSILGFNLGIEVMQLFVIAIIVPWLILASKTPAYKWVRPLGAVLAGIAAVAWIVERSSGSANVITTFVQRITQYSLWCIAALAAFCVFIYFSSAVSKHTTTLAS